jgi:hypothetical protein
MDLALYLRVLWRFRILLAAGTALAAALALFTVVHVRLEDGQLKVRYREPVLWSAQSTLLVTQEGFPWGRSILDEMVAVPAETPEPTLVPRFATPDRFISLALLYAELAKSDAVRRKVWPRDARYSTYEAGVVPDRGGAGYLPMVRVIGTSTSPANAVWVAERATTALKAFIDRQQDESRIAPRNRVQLNVVKKPDRAQISSERSKVKPAFVFLLVLTIVVGLAFVLENLRPRSHPSVVQPTTTDPVSIGLRRQA